MCIRDRKQSEDGYSVLSIHQEELLPTDGPLIMKIVKEKQVQTPVVQTDSGDNRLFELLRICRSQLARKAHVPPYMVFSDKTLHDMCAKAPHSREAVSYTHLDVYKRQVIHRCHVFHCRCHTSVYKSEGRYSIADALLSPVCNVCGKQRQKGDTSGYAVSYTHLRMQERTIPVAIDLCDLHLDMIEEDEDSFTIGAMTSLRALETHEGLQEAFGSLLTDALKDIVGVQCTQRGHSTRCV